MRARPEARLAELRCTGREVGEGDVTQPDPFREAWCPIHKQKAVWLRVKAKGQVGNSVRVL